jgi:sec-independent protein translocase protein TatB
MFDIGAAELLVIVVVAILVIGPKDMPAALRTAGQWIGKMRRMSAHFRSGMDSMIREAELEEAEKEWAKRNADIMAKDRIDPVARPDKVADPQNLLPDEEMQATQMPPPVAGNGAAPDAAAEAAIARAAPNKAPEHSGVHGGGHSGVKAAPKKAPPKKAPAKPKKSPAKKAPAKKATPKTAAKKAPPKKAPAKKSAPKNPAPKKPAPKKTRKSRAAKS